MMNHFSSLYPYVIKKRNEDGDGRPFVEARAQLFVMLAALAASDLTAVLVSPPARAATYTSPTPTIPGRAHCDRRSSRLTPVAA
jgi:hypothetical protein